jgi:hypothetical protein
LGPGYLFKAALKHELTQENKVSETPPPAGSIVVGEPTTGPSAVLGEEAVKLPEGEGVVTVDPRDPILKMVSGQTSTVRAFPASLPADGATGTTVIVTARTEEGKYVVGAPVNLESARGVQDEIEQVKGRTGYDGQAVFLVRSKEAGTAIFHARVGTRVLDEKGVVKFTPLPTLSVQLPPQMIVAALGILALILIIQYMFVRSILDARRFEEEELFFHHPAVLRK